MLVPSSQNLVGENLANVYCRKYGRFGFVSSRITYKSHLEPFCLTLSEKDIDLDLVVPFTYTQNTRVYGLSWGEKAKVQEAVRMKSILLACFKRQV